MNRPRTRFAPSPTGYLHLGNARTALHSALLARALGGIFLVRIEDTDAARSRPEYVTALLEDLAWLGLLWDEGPGQGEDGAYYQSSRVAIYQALWERLQQAGVAYPCFCSEEDLERARSRARAAGLPPRYGGTCSKLSQEEVASRLARGELASLRLRVPRDTVVEFDDLVWGPQRFRGQDLGDFVIRRSDGSPAFLFANAVDDALMGITHVLRGADHLTNTPRQLLVLQALDLPVPRYGHLSLIVGPDDAPLAKRHGARSLRELREGGYLPAAVANHLARLGHPYPEGGLLDIAGLAASFSIDRLGRAPAHHDEAQLRHWQEQAVLHSEPASLWSWLGDVVHQLVPVAQRAAFIGAVQPNLVFPADGHHWAQVIYQDPLTLTAEAKEVVTVAGPAFFQAALDRLSDQGDNYKQFSDALKKATGARGKDLHMPLRAALTGAVHGPELARLWDLFPKERIHSRLLAAMG